MSRYTVELREIVKSGLKVFNFPYEFYNESKKTEFEQKFINHFYFREIGVETVGRFQHYLKCKCDEVLPYYNMLLKTAEYDYDLKNNYNLTETFTKTNSSSRVVKGNASQSGITEDSSTVSGEKTNTLDSTTNHAEASDLLHDNTTTETGTIDKTSALIVDGKKVSSDTPNGLLSMEDIKTNVYASKADVEDSTNTTTDNQTSTAEKGEKLIENSTRSATDTVTAESHDSSTDTTNANGSFENETVTQQNEDGTGTESYTLERVGDIGVDTTPDKLRKHVEFQKIVTTAYQQFFDECEDLFMQIY